MEIPEKIYIPIACDELHYHMTCPKNEFKESVEYTRTDVIVERTEKYLHEHLVEYWSQRVTDGSKFIDDFIDYIKGE